MARNKSKKLRMDPEWSTNDLDGVLDFVSSFGPFGVVRSLFTGKTPTVPGLATVSGKVRQGVDNVFNWIGDKVSSLWNGLKESNIYRKYTGSGLTDAELQQNEFQERLSNTAYQRQVTDMQAAGVNPALTMGGTSSGASTPSGASPAGGASLGDLFGTIASLVSLPAQLNLLKSQAAKNFADAEGTQIDNQTRGEKNELTLHNLRSDLDSKEVQRQLAKSGITKNEAEAALANTQAALNKCDEKTREELNRAIIALKNAEAAKFTQDVKESVARIEVCKAEVAELMQRAITEAAQAYSLDAQAGLTEALKDNALVENGILKYDEKMKAFEYDKRGVKFWVENTTKTVTAAATAVGAAGLLKGARSKGYQPTIYRADANSFNPYVLM